MLSANLTDMVWDAVKCLMTLLTDLRAPSSEAYVCRMKKITIHAGTSKTATSTIQRCFHDNRLHLDHWGLKYATTSTKRPNNHDVAEKLMESAASVEDFFTALPNNSLISSEVFYLATSMGRGYNAVDYQLARNEYLDRLDSLTKDFHRTIIVTFRRPDEFVESLYKTAVLQGRTNSSFPEFTRQCLPLVNYAERLNEFQTRFENVVRLDYGKNIVADMFRAIDIPLPSMIPENRNVSPDSRIILWIKEKNDRGIDINERKRVRAFAISNRCTDLFPEKSTLWPDDRTAVEYAANAGWDCPAPKGGMPVVGLERHDARKIDRAYMKWRVFNIFQ